MLLLIIKESFETEGKNCCQDVCSFSKQKTDHEGSKVRFILCTNKYLSTNTQVIFWVNGT